MTDEEKKVVQETCAKAIIAMGHWAMDYLKVDPKYIRSEASIREYVKNLSRLELEKLSQRLEKRRKPQ